MRNASAIGLDSAMPNGPELHIASFVVQHRHEAADSLAATMAEHGGLELVRTDGVRSIVLCECEDQYALIDRIEALRAVPGVLNVSLVCHHAEPRAALAAPTSEPNVTGAGP